MWKKVVNISNYLFGGLLNIGLAVGLIALAYFVTMWAFDQGMSVFEGDVAAGFGVDVLVEIPEDADASAIARILLEHELIENEWLFRLEAVFNGSANHFMRGTFLLNTSMSHGELMDALQDMEFLQIEEGRIVVREGLANWQIADLAAAMGYFTSSEFFYELDNGFFSHNFLNYVIDRENRLQGFLFPDTYNLPPNPSPRDLIVRMLDRFDDIFTAQMWERLEEIGLSLEEIITIASIVEAETAHRCLARAAGCACRNAL